jgi:hypothetical protein
VVKGEWSVEIERRVGRGRFGRFGRFGRLDLVWVGVVGGVRTVREAMVWIAEDCMRGAGGSDGVVVVSE